MRYCDMDEAGKRRVKEANKRWRAKNPEKVKFARNLWYSETADARREAGRKSYHKNKHRRDPEKSRENARRWAANNREKSHEVRKAWVKKRSEENRDIKLSISCIFCGESEPRIMCFHHTEVGEKEFNIGYRMNSVSMKRLNVEISKCVVLCRNCHKRVHAGALVVPGKEGVPVPQIGRPRKIVEITNE